MAASKQARCSIRESEPDGQRCARPEHDGDDHDFSWSHPDSRVQTWTPPSKRGRG